jgi:hypothetical protein
MVFKAGLLGVKPIAIQAGVPTSTDFVLFQHPPPPYPTSEFLIFISDSLIIFDLILGLVVYSFIYYFSCSSLYFYSLRCINNRSEYLNHVENITKMQQRYTHDVIMLCALCTILSRVLGSVTNNNGFWVGWLDLLTPSFKITLNYNQLQQLTIHTILAPFIFSRLSSLTTSELPILIWFGSAPLI